MHITSRNFQEEIHISIRSIPNVGELSPRLSPPRGDAAADSVRFILMKISLQITMTLSRKYYSAMHCAMVSVYFNLYYKRCGY